MDKGNIYAYVVQEKDGQLLYKLRICGVPRVGDEIRSGGEGAEKYYKVMRVLWVYDEPECPFDRVNIGVKRTI